MITCQCPAAAAIPTIGTPDCPESFGQIQKVAFTRMRDANGNANKFTKTAAITLLASWEAKMSAEDGTKIAVSPYIQAPTSEAGEARTFGGGNETLGGVEEIIGRNPTTFSAVIRRCPQSIIAELKKLQCESEAGNLGVFLFDENGSIEAIKGTADGDYMPIPVRGFFVGDKTHGGLEAPDSNAIQWSFLPNYSDNLAIVTPSDFNPLTDL